MDCIALCRHIGLVGPANVQCKLGKDGTLWAFEVNARFCGSTSFAAACGFNGPDLAIRNKLYNDWFFPLRKFGLINFRTLGNNVITNQDIKWIN